MPGEAAPKRSSGSSTSRPPPSAAASQGSERQALLYRPSTATTTPCHERILFSLSGRQLWDILFILFLIHLILGGLFQAWARSLIVTIFADVFYALLCIFCFVLTTGSLLTLKTSTLCGFMCEVLWIFFAATLCWFSMLRISELHHLEVRCWGCQDSEKNTGMELGGLLDFASCWMWLPVGLGEHFAAVWWRPWWFFFRGIPQALRGQGALASNGNGLEWYQCREIIIGSIWQPSLLMLAALGRAIEEDYRWVVVLSLALSTLLAAIPFYLTSDPFMSFWWFLADPWARIFHWLMSSNQEASFGPISVEEKCAIFVMVWWFSRVVYVAASMRLEEWNARKHVEDGLRYALEHPFRAELEQGFGTWSNEGGVGIDVEQGGAVSAAAAAAAGLERLGSEYGPEGFGSLKAKRENLLEVCKAWRGSSAATPPFVSFRVRRSHLLEDTVRVLSEKPVTELLAPGMLVSFEDEKGTDAGGLTRDWFDSVAQALVDGSEDLKGNSLMAVAPDRTLVPRPVGRPGSSGDLPEAKERFRSLLAVGRFLALAVHRGQPLPLSFSTVACKHLLGVPVGMGDVQRLDPDFYRNRVAAVLRDLQGLEAALGEPLCFTSAPSEMYPEPEELKPGGATIIVTEENKVEYVQLLCEAYLCGGIRREIQCMLQGFWDLLPLELLRRCQVTPRELSLHISGIRNLDPEEWRLHSRETGGAESQVLPWFWEVVGELDEEHRCMLLHFATGSSRLPPAGFADLQPMFNVTVSPFGAADRLPVAHTCSNQVVLQEYQSKEQLREKLLLALATESFEII